MAGGQAALRGGLFPDAAGAAGEQLGGAVHGRVAQMLGILLRPFQRALVAVDAHGQAVVVARRHLRAPVGAVDAVFVLDDDVGVEVERLAVLVGGGDKALDLQARDVVDVVFNVGADVAHAVGRAGDSGVRAPDGDVGLRVVAGGQFAQEPVLRVFGVDGDDLADLALGDHFLHHLGHHIARVSVGNAKEQALFAAERFKFFRLFHGKAERLFAHHVDAGL